MNTHTQFSHHLPLGQPPYKPIIQLTFFPPQFLCFPPYINFTTHHKLTVRSKFSLQNVSALNNAIWQNETIKKYRSDALGLKMCLSDEESCRLRDSERPAVSIFRIKLGHVLISSQKRCPISPAHEFVLMHLWRPSVCSERRTASYRALSGYRNKCPFLLSWLGTD